MAFDPDAYLGGGSGGFDPDAYLKTAAPPAEKPNPGAQSGFGAQVMRGATFGGSDMLQGAVDATLNKTADFFEGKKGKSWHDYYDAELQRARDEGDKYAADHPVLSAVGQTLGGLASFNPTGGGAPTVGGLMKTALKGAGYGAAIGGTQGFVSGRGGFENRATNALVGGGVGAALGFATPFAFEGGRRLYNAGKSFFSNEVPENTVGRILTEATGGQPVNMEPAPLPGMSPSIGQSSGNPGLLYLERSVEQATPEGAQLGAQSRTASNNAVMDAVQKLGDIRSDAATDMLDSLEAARKASDKTVKTLWKQAGIDDVTPLNITPMKEDVKNYISSLTRSGKAKVPSNIANVFEDFRDTEPLSEVQDWRSDISTAFRQARKEGDLNAMRVLGNIQDRIDGFMEDLAGHRSDIALGFTADDALREEELARYNMARTGTRVHKATFAQPGSPVTTALSPREFGQAAESNTANLFIRPNTGAGAPEALDSYLKAVGDDPRALQAARDAFTQKFQNAITGVPDASGQPTIKAAAVSKFIDNYDHVINSKVFTDDQRALISQIKAAADMSARTARAGAPGGSDTFAKLSGKNWVDSLLMPGAQKVARTVGASVGYATGGPAGAAAGAYGAPKIMESILSANKAASISLLTQAIHDPALAQTLMQNATRANAAKMPLAMQAKIYGILSGRVGGLAAQSRPQPALQAQ